MPQDYEINNKINFVEKFNSIFKKYDNIKTEKQCEDEIWTN